MSINALRFLLLAIWVAQPSFATQSNSGFTTVPALKNYTFQSQESKLILGNSTEAVTGWNCNSGIKPADQIGNLAIVSTFYQNGCYTDGTYNHKDYLVNRGVVSNSAGTQQFIAYTVYEPAKKATQFLASQHVIYYKFPTLEAYSVYRFNATTKEFIKLADIPLAQVSITNFVKIANLKVSPIKGSVTYVFAPSRLRVSTYTLLAANIEGALVARNALVDVNKFRYTIAGQTLFDTRLGFNYGPGSWNNLYSIARQFFIVYNAAQQVGVVWQNKLDKSIKLTWISNNSFSTINLSNTHNELLTSATFDGAGALYYLTVQAGDGAPNTARTATLYKTKDTGELLVSRSLDTSKTGLNMVAFFNVASLKYANSTLGLMLSRKMHQSGDGLNHLGGIAVVFNANTLTTIINLGQTSGHSFGNVLTSNSVNQFIGIDLGDNYPRGVNLHRFTKSSKVSSLVYTFKTEHGKTPTSSAGVSYPRYDAISTALINYYQWSNDNNTYSELGGVIENLDGYSVFFAGEPDANGKALNNARVGSILNDARNIGMVKVARNFSGTLTDAMVLSSGAVETSGFYTFGGTWSTQRNKGVVWLTSYLNKNLSNVSRLKAVKLSENKILLLWERWTPTGYVNTYCMKVDSLGNVLNTAVALGAHVRLNRSDDAFVDGNNVYLVSGNKAERKLELIELKVK